MINAFLSLTLLFLAQEPAAPAAPASKPAVRQRVAVELPGQWSETIRYRVAMDDKKKEWSVWMGVQLTNTAPFEFWIPRWTPGGYHLVEFAQFIEDIDAEDDAGHPLVVKEVEEPRHWIIDPGNSKRVVIHYIARHSSPGGFDINPLDMEANRITKKYAFINSTSLFGFVAGLLDRPTEVTLSIPESWNVASPMPKNKNGAYEAPNYYRLEDSPFLMSPKLLVSDYAVDGVPHTVACYGKSEGDLKNMKETCEQISRAGKRMMGSLPYDHYAFLLSFSNENVAGGGLEHTFSTLILLPGIIPKDEIKHVLAHEYFHLWNAERIHVDKLQKPDYTKPLDTGTIWLNEGGTEYMSFLLLTQAEIETPEKFFAEMSQKNAMIHATTRKSERRAITAISHKWSSTAISGFGGLMEIQVGVYERGAVTCFALDLFIHKETDGKKGLTDVLRYMMENYVNKGKGYGEDELPEIVKSATGVDAADFFSKYINGPEFPDLDAFLEPMGLKMNRTPDERPAPGGFLDLEKVTDAQKAFRSKFFEPPSEKTVSR
ncbi:MAG: M61 family metallopeptidase [Planctomycetes bacterium]|nr:M61 family metallopeptidase [Planctomycetota bacterium]